MRGITQTFVIVSLLTGVILWAFPAHTLPVPENGVQRDYYSDGKVHLENVYKNGRLLRKRVFFPNGRVLLEERYKSEVLISKTSYYENGNVKSHWTKKSGVTKFYFEDGKLRVIVDNDPDKLNKNLPSSYIFSGSSK
jgi:antitoxin component YwqK of YwqJK toxin-antitoxin module